MTRTRLFNLGSLCCVAGILIAPCRYWPISFGVAIIFDGRLHREVRVADDVAILGYVTFLHIMIVIACAEYTDNLSKLV